MNATTIRFDSSEVVWKYEQNRVIQIVRNERQKKNKIMDNPKNSIEP